MSARKKKPRAVRGSLEIWIAPPGGRIVVAPDDFSAAGDDGDVVMIVPRAEWLRLKRIERAAKRAVVDLFSGIGEDQPPFVIVRLRQELKR